MKNANKNNLQMDCRNSKTLKMNGIDRVSNKNQNFNYSVVMNKSNTINLVAFQVILSIGISKKEKRN